MTQKFIFTRLVTVEERYSVTMSDEMANKTIAHKILLRSLGGEDKPSAVIELLDSKVVKTGRASLCE